MVDPVEKEVLALLDAPETPEERAAIDALPRDPARLLAAAQLRAGPGALRIRRQRRPWLAAAGGLAAAAAAVVAVVALRKPPDPLAVLQSLQGETRPLEVSLAGLPLAPYRPTRGAHDGAQFDKALRQLLEAREQHRPGAERALGVLYLLRGEPGDAARADEALKQAGDDALAENDRGVALFVRGELIGALEHFLRAQAQFNTGVTLLELGLRERAEAVFRQLPAAYGAESAQELARWRGGPPAPSHRLEVMRQLLAAGSEKELAAARAQAAPMPDLLALADKLDVRRLQRHAELYKVYKDLRERAWRGAATEAEADDFARRAEVQDDPLLWSSALSLAGYVHAARGDWRAAQPYEASLAGACKVRGCPVELQAIALDELADLAAQDGDFPAARKLQDRAEALFTSVGAATQLAELSRKRAALLDEEDRVPEAAAAVQAALQHTAGAQQASAAEQAEDIAVRLGYRHAAQELGEAALDLARAADERDEAADIVARLAVGKVALGDAAGARALLAPEIDQLTQAGHAAQAARLRGNLAEALLAQGDAAGALSESEHGLRDANWESTKVLLHSAHARALTALGRAPEASVERWVALDELAKSLADASGPLPEAAGALLSQLAATAANADELALPLDKLRAAMLHVPPAQAGWSRALPAGACVLTLIPAEKGALQGIATREGGAVRTVATDALASGTEKCAFVWLFAEPPLDKVAQANGVATSISRLLAPEPSGAPKRALLVSAQATGDIAAVATALPGAADEAAALRAAGAEVTEVSGERATPAHALELAADEPFVHFAVHGFAGAFLQLAGEGGRLAARDIAQAKLQPGARVVLSACEAGAPGPRGVAWAFARAGASEIAAPREAVADAAAAEWSREFYAALSRGESFPQAAAEARAARFLVVK